MGSRRKSDDLSVAALACGKTQVEAAELAGVSERTVRRRLEDTAFAQAIVDARDEIVANSAAQLTALFSKAIATLDDAFYSLNPNVRLRAADLVFRHGADLRTDTNSNNACVRSKRRRHRHLRPPEGRSEPAISGHDRPTAVRRDVDPFPKWRNPFPHTRETAGKPGFLHAPRGRGMQKTWQKTRCDGGIRLRFAASGTFNWLRPCRDGS